MNMPAGKQRRHEKNLFQQHQYPKNVRFPLAPATGVARNDVRELHDNRLPQVFAQRYHIHGIWAIKITT